MACNALDRCARKRAGAAGRPALCSRPTIAESDRACRIATWNINGIRARLDGAVKWVERGAARHPLLPGDQDRGRGVPARAFEDLGYNVEIHGQKSFNGVALLSKLPFDEVSRGLPGDDADAQARFIEGVFSVKGGAIRVASLYLPNGNPVGTDKFAYKFAWMDRLEAYAQDAARGRGDVRARRRLQRHPRADRRALPRALGRDALFQPETRARYRRLLNLGLTCAFRACSGRARATTRSGTTRPGAWQRNNGIRIDHQLLSPLAADRLGGAQIDKRTRSWDKPSDHVPVMIELDV